MSRVPYRALMRPQRTPPVQRPGFFPDPPSPRSSEPAPVVEEPVVEVAPEPEPVVEPEPVLAPEPEPEPVAAPVVPKVNSASSKTDLLAAAAALGLTTISATNTRAEIWAAIQAAAP